jgi:RNA polymerase sigma-70 factor, ECF subfamily
MTSSQGHTFVSRATAARLLATAAPPADWTLTTEQFQSALERSARQRFQGETSGAAAGLSPDARRTELYLEGLHLAELSLACACAAGNSAAWDHFVSHYRRELYRAARAIAGESAARDLADSLYAELYGLRESAQGVRNSLFHYFHGRSKLTTWLRAILAQRHVDHFRSARNTESLDDSEPGEMRIDPVAPDTSVDSEREKYLAMMQAALARVLDSLPPRDRLRLAYYYADELTLAQIGKLLGEHEATVSRKLDRTRREVRRRVEAALQEKELSEAQLQLCFEYAQQQWPFDLTRRLRAGGAASPAGTLDAGVARE